MFFIDKSLVIVSGGAINPSARVGEYKSISESVVENTQYNLVHAQACSEQQPSLGSAQLSPLQTVCCNNPGIGLKGTKNLCHVDCKMYVGKH